MTNTGLYEYASDIIGMALETDGGMALLGEHLKTKTTRLLLAMQQRDQ